MSEYLTSVEDVPQPISPLRIPEGRVGQYQIQHCVHPAGHEYSTASARTAMFAGHKKETRKYPHQTYIHKLTGPTGTWMTDLPIEQAQITANVDGMKGDILVGGLGLGYVLHVLAAQHGVRRIHCVEKSKEVIQLVENSTLRTVWETNPKVKVNIIHDDLFHYLKAKSSSHKEEYDHAFYDIWQLDNENTFFHTVCPLLQKSEEVIRQRPVCWNEDVMRGQLQASLVGRILMMRMKNPLLAQKAKEDMLTIYQKSLWINWSVPFFRYWFAKQPNSSQESVAISFYVHNWLGGKTGKPSPSFLAQWSVFCAENQ